MASKGIILMIVGSGLLTANDACMKLVVVDMPVTQTIFVRSLLVGTVLLFLRGNETMATIRNSPTLKGQLLCASLLAGSILLFTGSLPFLSLPVATTAFYLSPVFVVLLAPRLLNERPNKEKLIAAIIGLTGVAFVVFKPSVEFSWAILLPLAAAFTNAIRDIELRRFIRGVSTFSIVTFTQIFIALLLFFPSIFVWSAVEPRTIVIMILSGLFYGGGIWSSIEALRHHDAGFVVPFKYAGVLWSGVAGFILWRDMPTAFQILGAIMLVAAGVYLTLSTSRNSVPDA